jgi:Domain of unknown function DUF11
MSSLSLPTRISIAVLLCLHGQSFAADSNLEPGFPVQMQFNAGNSWPGSEGHAPLIIDLDGDGTSDIVSTLPPDGIVYAWDGAGQPLTGFPSWPISAPAQLAAGEFDGDATPELFLSYFTGWVSVMNSDGSVLPGYPIAVDPDPLKLTEMWSSPALADVDDDGLTEAFYDAENRSLYAVDDDGSALDGWPYEIIGGFSFDYDTDGSIDLYIPVAQRWMSPAIADLNDDGMLEVIFQNSHMITSDEVALAAFTPSGALLDGFPVQVDAFGWAGPVVGDVTGGPELEIIVPAFLSDPIDIAGNLNFNGLLIVGHDGAAIREIPLPAGTSQNYLTPNLADLDGDGRPEIIIQMETFLTVIDGEGVTLPGWPVVLPEHRTGEPGTETADLRSYFDRNTMVAVADVDGDALPDLVTVFPVESCCRVRTEYSEVYAFDRFGRVLPEFPKVIHADGMNGLAIADIDGDGRNEIVIGGFQSWGTDLFNDAIWAFDLGGPPHGAVEWGQYKGNARRDGTYARRLAPATSEDLSLTAVLPDEDPEPNVDFDIIYGVSNLSPSSASNPTFMLMLPDELSTTDAVPSSGSCSTYFRRVLCRVNDLASASAMEVRVRLRSTSEGEFALLAQVGHQGAESALADNAVSNTISIVALPTDDGSGDGSGGGGSGGGGSGGGGSGGGGSGGGGSIDLFVLLLLGLFGWSRTFPQPAEEWRESPSFRR